MPQATVRGMLPPRASSESTSAADASVISTAPPTPCTAGRQPPRAPSGGARSAAAAALQYRLATQEDFWSVADVHCAAFHADASPTVYPLHCLDRVLSLHIGEEAPANLAACLAAYTYRQANASQSG